MAPAAETILVPLRLRRALLRIQAELSQDNVVFVLPGTFGLYILFFYDAIYAFGAITREWRAPVQGLF